MFGELVGLLRGHLPFWSACLAAWHAARAAAVFQRGHNRVEYEGALGDPTACCAIIRRSCDQPFAYQSAARRELEWWIIHRERATYAPGDLERAPATVQASIYQLPESAFGEHAPDRARAMLLRDEAAAAGGVSENDWRTIGTLLDSCWFRCRRRWHARG